MYCMKCGRELKDAQVFCPACLEVMSQYPVKPGTPIQLPSPVKGGPAPARQTRRKVRKPEEQILRLRSTVRWLCLALAAALLAFAATVFMMLWLLNGPGWQPLF